MKIIVPILGNTSISHEDNDYMKALGEIRERTILQRVVDSLSVIADSEFIFIVGKDDVNRYHIDNILRLIVPDCKVIISQTNTKGSACTCMLAIDEIVGDEPIIISGYNQLINLDLNAIIADFIVADYDAGVIIFDDIHPRWSYVKLDNQNLVIEAAEKNPISRNAMTGLFYFKHYSDFIHSAVSMISKGVCVGEKYYVSPTLNEMILANKVVGTYRINKSEYYNLGSESGIDALKRYLGE